MSSPEHTVFDSVEEMLTPRSLSALLGTSVETVTLRPLQSNGFSTNELCYVGLGDRRLVLKRLHHDDWMARSSRDEGCRSVAVWQTGLLDRLEPRLRHGIVAGSRDGRHHALLMSDCSAGLRRWSGPDTSRRMDTALEALAWTHARYWNDDSLAAPRFELADIETLLAVCWPRSWPVIEHHPAAVELLQRGWQALLDLVDSDVRATIEQLLGDPTPLVRALEAEPRTLLHGDYRPDNMAVMDDGSVTAFDWQMATHGPGVLDLAWLVNGGDTFAFRSWAFDRYRDHLAGALAGELDVPRWERALAIANVAEVLRKGNWHALFAVEGDAARTAHFRTFIPAYNASVRDGAALL